MDLTHRARITRLGLQLGLALSLGLMLPNAGLAEGGGYFPSLDIDLSPSPTGEYITPVSDMMPPSTTEASSARKTIPVQRQSKAVPSKPKASADKPDPKPVSQAPSAATPALEVPMPNLTPQAHQDPRHIKPVSFSPAPAIAIFPVIKHRGGSKAFSDLPILFAREYALRMEKKAPDTQVYHPVYAVNDLRLRGLGHVYDQIMAHYRQAGRPDPVATDYLLKQLSASGQPIARLIFVEADLDTHHPMRVTNPIDKIHQWVSDAMPKDMKYFVRSRIQVFDAEAPSFPMIWGNSWQRSIKTQNFYNLTSSVFDDSDSQQSFARLSRKMSREISFITPKHAYMMPQYDTLVQGEVLSSSTGGASGHSDTVTNSNTPISAENIQAIQRVLQRQKTTGTP